MKTKRLLILALTFCLCIGLLSTTAFASDSIASDKYQNTTFTIVNKGLTRSAVPAGKYLTTPEAVADVLRDAMTNRQASVSADLMLSADDFDGSDAAFSDLMDGILDLTFAHTGVPTEGDYLRWVYDGMGMSTSYFSDGEYWYLSLTFEVKYYTTAAQEAELTKAVNALLAELITGGMTDYEKLTAVYDWMTGNIVYDYDNLNDSTYMLKHTAYAAMINRTSVCQGYATLLYRLALEMDIDCRYVSGHSNGEGHGWNIVKLGGRYYNVDATWDTNFADNDNYQYYLRNEANFVDHTRDAEFDSETFHAAYPMSSTDYTPDNDPCANGHSYTSKVTAATCTEPGYTTHTCSVCGNSYVDANTPSKGHSYGNWTTTKAATCTADGTQKRSCSACSVSETMAIDATGHSYASKVTAPTCTEQGYTTYTCSACGSSYVDAYTSAKGHSYGSWSTIKAATCTAEGSQKRTCSVCSVSETKAIPYIGHSYSSKVTAPTCTEQGYTTYTCSNCGNSYKDAYTSTKGHSYGSWSTTKAATCTAEGTQRRTCSRCSVSETKAIPYIGHNYSSKVTVPTCTEQGYTTYTCSNCGNSYKDAYTSAKGHSYGSWTTTKAATCTAEGSQKRTCSRCSVSETKAIAAIGHKYTSKVTAPTCTEQGYTTYTCSNCGNSYKDAYTSAKGHSYGSWSTTKAATCTAEGSQKRTCSRCSVSETKAIPATGHNYVGGKCTACGASDGTVQLDAPVAKATNVTSSGKIRISWNAVEGAEKYEIYRSDSANGTFTRKYTTRNTQYTNTGAAAGETYWYYVKAIGADGSSADSGIVSCICKLARPSIKISNVASTGYVRLTWQEVKGAVSYKVYRSATKDGNYRLMRTSPSTTYTNTSADPGETYYYKVMAVAANTAANSAYSTSKARTCDLAQPAIKVSNRASDGKITVKWEAVEGATKYQVYRSATRDGTYIRISTTTSTSITNTSAKAGKTYYYKVRAICDEDAAASAYSSIKSRTCDLERPDVSITRSGGKPKLSWDKVPGAVKYKIYRATSRNGTYSLVKTTTSRSWKDTKAKSGRTYYYKVVAVCSNTAGNSAYSNVRSIKSR